MVTSPFHVQFRGCEAPVFYRGPCKELVVEGLDDFHLVIDGETAGTSDGHGRLVLVDNIRFSQAQRVVLWAEPPPNLQNFKVKAIVA